MQPRHIIGRLAENPKILALLARGIAPDQWRWKPAPDSWSALELLAHLLDEEREDFRAHLEAALADPPLPWAPIDPAGWVTAREYNRREPSDILAGFLDARSQSLAWINGLTDPDWSRILQAPFGPIRAGDLLVSWAAHDLHGIRQLTELHHAWLTRSAAPFSLAYAGDW